MARTFSPLRLLPFLLAFLVFTTPALAGEWVWDDTSRDVYLEGELRQDAVVLSSGEPKRLAVFLEGFDEAVLFDLETQTIAAAPRDAFHFNAKGAVSAPLVEGLRETGAFHRIPDGRSTHLWARSDHHHLLVSPHQGPAGALDRDQLWSHVPNWQRRWDLHEPEDSAVHDLAGYDGKPVEVTIAFGTWCGDSRGQVPALLKAIDQAQNPRLQVRLLAIGRGFTTPAEVIHQHRLTNVPTVVVTREGDEIGRSVETPTTETLASDLVSILGGSLPPHPGRYERQSLLAEGRYAYRDPEQRMVAQERWQLFDDGEGGRLARSEIDHSGARTIIWQGRRADGTSAFAEVTRHHGDSVSRTRAWVDPEGHLRAVTRGDRSGIVDQRLTLPPGSSLVVPAAVAAAADLDRLGTENLVGFRLHEAGQPVAGERIPVVGENLMEESISTPAGRFSGRTARVESGGAEALWWIHPELGIPVAGELGGLRIELEELVVPDTEEKSNPGAP